MVNRALRRYRAAGNLRHDPQGFTPCRQRRWSQFFALGDPSVPNDIMRGAPAEQRRNWITGHRAVMQWARAWGRR